MHDTELDLGLGKDTLDRFRKALKSIHAGDEDVLHTPVLQLRHHLQPELSAFGLRNPQPQHFLQAVHPNPDRQVNCLVLNVPAVPDFELNRIQIHDRIDRFQLPVLPGPDFINHLFGDIRDQSRRHLYVVDLFQVFLDLARRQAPRVQRNDVLIKPGEARLMLLNDLRLEGSVPVPRHLQRHPPKAPLERLG